MIYRTEPKGWKELQDKVSEILNEAGISAETPKIIHSVRNDYEIDVYAKEDLDYRTNEILVECKNWNTKIPQTIVHAFRTTMNDVGANTGYIISRKGFQTGAVKAAEFTNIKLVTWYDFQLLFEDKWREEYFSNYIENNWRKLITESEFAPSESLISIYGWMLLKLKTIPMFFHKTEQLKLPLKQYESYQKLPEDLINETGFKELIPLLHKYCDSIQESL